jgi:hypothetical protein
MKKSTEHIMHPISIPSAGNGTKPHVGGSCRITYRKLSTGNYTGRAGGFYFFIYKREHGRWDGFDKYVKWYTVRIGYKGDWLAAEGQFGSYLKTIKKAKGWVKDWLLKNAR